MGFFGHFQAFHVIIWSHPAEKQPIYECLPPKMSIDTETDGLEKCNSGFNYVLLDISGGSSLGCFTLQ